MKNKMKKLILGMGGVLSIAGVVGVGTSASLKQSNVRIIEQSEFTIIDSLSDFSVLNPLNNILNISLVGKIDANKASLLPQLIAFNEHSIALLGDFIDNLKATGWYNKNYLNPENETLRLFKSVWTLEHFKYSSKVKIYSDEFLTWMWDNFIKDIFLNDHIDIIKRFQNQRYSNFLSYHSNVRGDEPWHIVWSRWMYRFGSFKGNRYFLKILLFNKLQKKIVNKFKLDDQTFSIQITINGSNYKITPKNIINKSEIELRDLLNNVKTNNKNFDADYNFKPNYYKYNNKNYMALPFIIDASGKPVIIELSKLSTINIVGDELKKALLVDRVSVNGLSSSNHSALKFDLSLGKTQWKSWKDDLPVVLPTNVLVDYGNKYYNLGLKNHNLFTVDELHRIEGGSTRTPEHYKNELNNILENFDSSRFSTGGATPDPDLMNYYSDGGKLFIDMVFLDDAKRIASYRIIYLDPTQSSASGENILWLHPKGNLVVNRNENTETFNSNWNGDNLVVNNSWNINNFTSKFKKSIIDFYKAHYIWSNSDIRKEFWKAIYKNKSWITQLNLTDHIAEFKKGTNRSLYSYLVEDYVISEMNYGKFYKIFEPIVNSIHKNTSILKGSDLRFVAVVLMNFITYVLDASRYDKEINIQYGQQNNDNWMYALKNSTSEDQFVNIVNSQQEKLQYINKEFAKFFVKNNDTYWAFKEGHSGVNELRDLDEKLAILGRIFYNSSDTKNSIIALPISSHRTLDKFILTEANLVNGVFEPNLLTRSKQPGQDAVYYPYFIVPEIMSNQRFYWGTLRDYYWFNTTENRNEIIEKEKIKEISVGARFYPIQKTEFNILTTQGEDFLTKQSRNIDNVPVSITIAHPSNKVGNEEQIKQFITNEWRTNIGSLVSRNLKDWERATRSITVDPTKITIEFSPIENFAFYNPIKTIRYKLKYDISNNPYMSAMYNGRDYIYLTNATSSDGYFTMNYTEGNKSAIKSFENDNQLPPRLVPVHLPMSEESLRKLVKDFIVRLQIDNPFLNNGTKINENNFVNGDERPSREKFIKINLNYGALGIPSITSFDTLMQHKATIADEKMNKLIEIIGADLNDPTKWFTRYVYNMKSTGFENGAIEGKRNYQSETNKIIDLGDKKIATTKDNVVLRLKAFFGVDNLGRDDVTKYLKFKFKGHNDENFGDDLEFRELLTKFEDQSVIDYLNDKERLNIKKDKVKIQVIFDEVKDDWWNSLRPEIIKPSSNIILTLSKNHSLDDKLKNQSVIRDFIENDNFNNTIFNLDKINNEAEFKEYIKTKIESLKLQNLIAKEHKHDENVKVNANNFTDDTTPNKDKFLKILIDYGVFNNALITNIETLKKHYDKSYDNKLNKFITIIGANLGNPTAWDAASINLKVNYPRITKGFRNVGSINNSNIDLSSSVNNVSHTMLVERIAHVLGVDNINESHTTLSKFEFYFNQLDGLDEYGNANFTFDKLKNNEDGIWNNALNHLNDTSNSKSIKYGFKVKIKYLGNDNFNYLNDDIKLYGDKDKEIIVNFVKDHRNALGSIESIIKLNNGNIKVVFNRQNSPVVDNQGNHMVIKLRKNDAVINYTLNLDGDLWNKSIENNKSVWEFKLSDNHYDQNGFILDNDYEVVSIGYKAPNEKPEVQPINSLFRYNVSSSNTYKTLLSELNKYNTLVKIANQNKLSELRNYANRYNIPNRNKFIDEVISIYSQSIDKYVDGINVNSIPNTKKLMENNEDITLLTNNLKDKLQTSSNKLDQLINLYKDEYTKYAQIYGLNDQSQTDSGILLSELRSLTNDTTLFNSEIIDFNNKNNKFDIINGETVRVFKHNEDISHDYSNDYSEEFLALLNQENIFDYNVRLEKLNEDYQTITNHYQKVNESLKKLGNIAPFMKQNNLLKDKILKDIIKDIISGELLKNENTFGGVLHNVGVLDTQMKTLLTLNPQYENIDKFKELFNKGKVDLNNLTNLFNEELNKEKIKVDEELTSKQEDEKLAKFKTESKVKLQSLQGFINESLYDGIINEIDTVKYEDIAKYDNKYNSLINGVNYINENLNFEGGNEDQNLKLRKIVSKRIMSELINNSKFDNIIDNINTYFVKDGDNTLTNINKYLKMYQNKANKDILKDILSKLYEDLPLTNDWNVYETFEVKETKVKQEIIQDVKNKYLNTLSRNINELETYKKVITKLQDIIASGDIETILNDIPRIYNEEVEKFNNKNKQEIQSANKRPVQILIGVISATVGVVISVIVGIIVRRNIIKRKKVKKNIKSDSVIKRS